MSMNGDLFPEVITLNGVDFEFNLDDDVSINNADLDREFTRQVELFARYSTAYELSMYEVSKHKMELDNLAANIDVAARKQADESGVKLTVSMADHTIKGNLEYQAKQDELFQSQRTTGLLKQARDAMIQKKDMLIQLGYNQRQERGSDITMKTDYMSGNS